ncbi:MAG: amphi-Trp domain-containing protein [Candidatus Thermoplasmatota archaeon]|nr:amphi-Trp domain-containing protein [Candidatus Thermoplasmatota archaeon]
MPEIPNESEGEKRVVKEGDLEHEVYLDSEDIADFLEGLAEQMREGDQVKIETEEWDLPFTFREPIELDIDFEGYGERELEIEIEMKGKREDKAPTVS